MSLLSQEVENFCTINRHVQVYHEIDGKYLRYEKFLKCSWARCGGSFLTAEDRIEHIRRVHLKDDPFTCKDSMVDCKTVYEASHHGCQV